MRIQATLLVTLTTPAAAQDARFFVHQTTEPGLYVISAEFLGAVPAGATLDTAWADASFRLTGDAPITFDGFNPGYRSDIFGDPNFNGDGTTDATFTGVMLGSDAPASFGANGPDSSNPLLAASFRYNGDIFALGFSLVGQNSVLFTGNPSFPLGQVEFYQDALGNPGTRSFDVALGFGLVPVEDIAFFIPAPGTLAFAPLALVAARRRRK